MRQTTVFVLAVLFCSIPLGCSEHPFELGELKFVFSEIPVVPILFPGEGKKVSLGSATVVGDRKLLLSPHLIPRPTVSNTRLPNGPILVDNCLWLYSIDRQVDGPTDASGWAIISLTKLGDYSREELKLIPVLAARTEKELDRLLAAEDRFQCELPEISESVKFDFECRIPSHKSVAIACVQIIPNDRKLRYYNPDLRYFRKPCLGRIYKPLIQPDVRLREFSLLKTEQSIPAEASGAPAYILGDDYKTAIIVGINSGKIVYDEPREQYFQLIHRPHELRLPLNTDFAKANEKSRSPDPS